MRVLAALVAFFVVTAPVAASIGYDAAGRVTNDGTGQEVSWQSLTAPDELAVFGMTGFVVSALVPMAAAPAAVLAWGAYRTERYRSDETKARVRAAVARRAAPSGVVGSLAW